jgi:hypothetical protein
MNNNNLIDDDSMPGQPAELLALSALDLQISSLQVALEVVAHRVWQAHFGVAEVLTATVLTSEVSTIIRRFDELSGQYEDLELGDGGDRQELGEIHSQAIQLRTTASSLTQTLKALNATATRQSVAFTAPSSHSSTRH